MAEEKLEAVKDVEEEKTAIVPASEKKPDDSKALAISIHDLSYLPAMSNRALKKISSINAWENSKKAEMETELKKKEEEIEKKKAGYAEEVKNKIALIHKEAEEKRAVADARRGAEVLKAEKKAAKYRATELVPVLQRRLIDFFQA
ncbi:hypothetical protein B296_00016455 [Ensete ventricosum]|uniref:Remorin C-terminal domain-containing protein n=1 Tax=Ensete ventricosum TaxID=4639 RepID=A0A426YY74_ENSVE|nr:hypothetical protein B296_00016455 [Ensete ventricosum]